MCAGHSAKHWRYREEKERYSHWVCHMWANDETTSHVLSVTSFKATKGSCDREDGGRGLIEWSAKLWDRNEQGKKRRGKGIPDKGNGRQGGLASWKSEVPALTCQTDGSSGGVKGAQAEVWLGGGRICRYCSCWWQVRPSYCSDSRGLSKEQSPEVLLLENGETSFLGACHCGMLVSPPTCALRFQL